MKNRGHPHFFEIISLMFLLEIYQLAEFLLCIGVEQNIVGIFAIIAITFLPPMGYLFSVRLTSWKYKEYWIWFVFGSRLSIYYIFTPDSIVLLNCNLFYAINGLYLGELYGYYYFGVILLSLIMIGMQIFQKKVQKDRNGALYLLIGYLSFLIPMGISVVIEQEFIWAIPSIMCKYAFL